ncbi:MAG: glycosyltransferase family 4 protein, partial [Burkholderiales bacterium]|nr:glycosyltransferase family 4 protein [Burkholderiales bacterium]
AFDNGDGSADEIVKEVGYSGVTATVNPCEGPLDFSAFHRLHQYVKRHQINVIHSHKYKTTFYAIMGRLFCRYKLITTYHNWLYDSIALRCYAWLDKRLARFNDVAIAVSSPVAAELRRHMTAATICQIGNGIDLSRFDVKLTKQDARRMLGLAQDGNVIGFVGRLSPEKGLNYLIEAAQLMTDKIPRLSLIIAGDGPEHDRLHREIQSRGLTKVVHLLGNRKDTPVVYAAMDVFALPSIDEAFPMVLLEAMASRRPVVATQVGEVCRIVTDHQTGYVVPPRQPNALANALTNLLSQPEKLESISQAAHLHAQRHFSSRTVAGQYQTIYLQLLKGKR